MFQRESMLNQFSIGYLETLAAEVTPENFNSRPTSSGHPPVWILGHLAICGELGIKLLGGELSHPTWMVLFGPGSSDELKSPETFSKEEFFDVIKSSYAEMVTMANNASAEQLDASHGIDLLDGTPINTVGDLIAHLLTTHFAFHSAQLSDWRRASGHEKLF